MQESIFFHKTLWLLMMYNQSKFGCRRISSSEDVVESYFDHMSPRCDLDLEDSKQFFFFCMTIWLTMLHHHTKFGYKLVCGSEDIIRINIHYHFDSSL